MSSNNKGDGESKQHMNGRKNTNTPTTPGQQMPLQPATPATSTEPALDEQHRRAPPPPPSRTRKNTHANDEETDNTTQLSEGKGKKRGANEETHTTPHAKTRQTGHNEDPNERLRTTDDREASNQNDLTTIAKQHTKKPTTAV